MNKPLFQNKKANLKRKKALVHSPTPPESSGISGFASALKSSLIATGITIVIGLVLVLIASMIAYSTEDPDSLVSPLALTALYVSSFLGGIVAAKINHRSALLCGLLVGVYMITIMFFISICFPDTMANGQGLMLKLGLNLAVIIAAIVGAYLGTSQKSKTNKRRKH